MNATYLVFCIALKSALNILTADEQGERGEILVREESNDDKGRLQGV